MQNIRALVRELEIVEWGPQTMQPTDPTSANMIANLSLHQ